MSTPSPTTPRTLPLRVVDWFWRGQVLRAARAQDDAERTSLFFEQKARIAAEVGQRILEPSAPWLAGDAEHLASAMFAESIAWSLRLANAKPGSMPSPSPAAGAELAELAAAERARLAAAAGDEATLTRVVENLLDRRFETQPLTQGAAQQAARELSNVANALLRTLAVKHSRVEAILLQRATRVGLLVCALLAVVLGGGALRDRLERRADLAAGKAWSTSSQEDSSCVSPQQECDGGKGYFFHTREERNPWLEIDLGKTEQISKVRVLNREDCCAERATPLVVEVSNDRSSWHEVARRKESFDEWTARFSPLSARYVRLKVARRSFLHLRAVRVF